MKKGSIHIVFILLAGLLTCGKVYAQDNVIRQLRSSLLQQTDSIRYTDVLNQLGMQYHLSNIDSCFWYAVKARGIATRLHDSRGLAGALNNLSIFYALKDNQKQAIEYGFKALLLYRELNDQPNVCQVLMNLSVFHFFEGMKPEADQYLYQAMNLGQSLTQDSIYSLVLINFASRYEEDSTRRDSVKWALEKSKEIIRKYPGSRDIYYIQAFEADEWMRDGEGAKAVHRINELADKALKEGLIGVAIDLLDHIEVYKQHGYPADALPAKEKAFAIGSRAGYLNVMLPTVVSLYRYYAKGNNEAKKAYYGKALLDIVRQRLKLRSSNHMNYLDYFLKEQELNEWQLSNKVQEQRIAHSNMKHKSRLQLIGFLAGCLLLMAGFTLARYRSYKNLRRQEELLREMNDAISEKNQQLSVHDDFKNKLIAILARDFREPLNDIINVSALFRNKDMDQAAMQRTIDEAVMSSRKTLVIFDNILRWIRSQLSGFVYSPAPCDLKLLFEQVAHSADQQQVVLDIPSGLCLAGDQEMLLFINRSLLHGATVISRGIGIIQVRAAVDDLVKVSILFEAPAFTPDMGAHLFEYRKGDDLSVTLVICKDFMDKMGGQISADVVEGKLKLGYSLPSFG
ncbi:sensor histidine kinase [Chitinophaga agri]|uniref:HAMP domain-containing histidine kinase n=1 Tax=Chitinophaga agri TaxID=2703787 RepID=A0A6B9ZG05_9BACT|nr:HAMP domain-containing histidine kinase [Chitinophaga agri]QHS60679.1 HAMP domain-containing histidine kinase [Chitinophaga agri]